MKLSLALITFNEEANLARTLTAAAGLADEIVIVDSYSTDRTRDIARAFGARVISQVWQGFAAQKNFLFSECQGEWILSLDADEVLSPELKAAIQKQLQTQTQAQTEMAGYILKRRTVYMDKLLKHAFADEKLRLVKKAANPLWEGDLVHEKLVLDGKVASLPGVVLHYSYVDFTDHFKRSIRYAALGAEKKWRAGERFSILKLLLRPPVAFLKSYGLKRGFLDGLPGLIVSYMRALDVWLKYLYLWEIARAAAPDRDDAHTDSC